MVFTNPLLVDEGGAIIAGHARGEIASSRNDSRSSSLRRRSGPEIDIYLTHRPRYLTSQISCIIECIARY